MAEWVSLPLLVPIGVFLSCESVHRRAALHLIAFVQLSPPFSTHLGALLVATRSVSDICPSY
jgi:hypothetical protein